MWIQIRFLAEEFVLNHPLILCLIVFEIGHLIRQLFAVLNKVYQRFLCCSWLLLWLVLLIFDTSQVIDWEGSRLSFSASPKTGYRLQIHRHLAAVGLMWSIRSNDGIPPWIIEEATIVMWCCCPCSERRRRLVNRLQTQKPRPRVTNLLFADFIIHRRSTARVVCVVRYLKAYVCISWDPSIFHTRHRCKWAWSTEHVISLA